MIDIDPLIHQAEINYKADYFNPQNPHPGETLLQVLDYCFQAKIPVPKWAQDEYRKCYKKYQARIGLNPLVTAFDTDHDAGKQRGKQHRQLEHLQTVCHTLHHLRVNEGWSIGPALFEEVATRHGNVAGLSASTIQKEYFPILKQFTDLFGGFIVCPEFVKPGKPLK